MSQKKINILYCEDDLGIREAMSSIILNHFPNASITICSNGLEGRRKVTESSFELVISDYQMGIEGGDGISLYKAFREDNSESPFVMLSGESESLFSDIAVDKNFIFFSKGSDVERKLSEKISRYFI